MKKIWKQLIVALIFTVAFAIIVPIGVFCKSSVPNITVPYDANYYVINYWHVANHSYPVLSMQLSVLLTSEGSLSVNNPVNVFVQVWGVNATNLLTSYDRIAFTDGYEVNSTGNPKQYPLNENIPLTESKKPGYYVGQGKVTWLVPDSTWIYFVPTNQTIPMSFSEIENLTLSNPVATIASATDTVSIQNGIRTEQLNWILLGVGILAVEPIVSTFIPDDKSEQAGSPE